MLAIILFVSLLQSVTPSYPLALQPDTTYQTGTQIVITSNFASTTEQIFSIPYVSVMTTSSLNATLGIYGINYYLNGTTFGWKLYIASLTSSNLNIHLAVFSTLSPIYYLKLCYLISSRPDLDINYVEYTYNRMIAPI
jgi:hypothetical protein